MTDQERTEMLELKDARIAYLERQVVERDVEIAQLRAQVADRDATIVQLRNWLAKVEGQDG